MGQTTVYGTPNGSGKKTTTTTTNNNTSYPTNTGGRTGDYNKVMSMAKDIRNKTLGNKSLATMVYEKNAKPDLPDRSDLGGSKGSGTASGYDYSAWFNYLMDLQDQKYNALTNAYKEQWQRKNDETNRNYMRSRRDQERIYSNQRNGQGLSNLFNIMSNRDTALRDNRSEFNTNMANAMAQRYDNVYGLTSMLPSMNEETLRKVMANVQNRGL